MTHEEMDRLTGALDSKAAKVRELYRAGVSTGDISRYLQIRYQHTYNVLLRAGLIEKGGSEATAQPDAPGEIIVAQVDGDGAIRLPAEIMSRYGIVAGEPVYCEARPEGLMVLSREAAFRQVTAIAREKMPEQLALIEALLGRNGDKVSQSP